MEFSRENLQAFGETETRIVGLEAERKRLPEQIADAEARAQAARDAVTAQKAAVAASEKARRDKEIELQDCEAQRTRFQGQTALVKTNQEYTALLGEIDGMTRRISEIEDEILEAMESTEEASARLVEVEAEQKEVERAALADAESYRKRLAEVEGEIEAQAKIRDGLLEELGPKVQTIHARLSAARGVVVAAIVANNCAACHRAVPPEIENRVLAGELHTCANCQRILIQRID